MNRSAPAPANFKTLTYKIILSCCVFMSLSNCGGGGGGGGGDFIGAATATLHASPTNIDTDDRMLVSIDLNEVNDNGIALKVKFPLGLTYVLSSSSLSAEDQSLDISPAVNVIENNNRFLVFYLSRTAFGRDNNGQVQFLLEGQTRVIEGKLEVDADVDDPLIDNSQEFDQKNPGFAAEDSVDIVVDG